MIGCKIVCSNLDGKEVVATVVGNCMVLDGMVVVIPVRCNNSIWFTQFRINDEIKIIED